METRHPRSAGMIIWAWLPVALWVGATQGFAGDSFSEESTSRFIGPLLRWLFPEADPDTIYAMHFTIRKTAHVVEYAILTLLALRAYRLSFALRGKHLVLCSLALVFAVECLDEFRQATSEVRGGHFTDVLLDLAGGLMVVAGLRLWERVRGSPGPQRVL